MAAAAIDATMLCAPVSLHHVCSSPPFQCARGVGQIPTVDRVADCSGLPLFPSRRVYRMPSDRREVKGGEVIELLPHLRKPSSPGLEGACHANEHPFGIHCGHIFFAPRQ